MLLPLKEQLFQRDSILNQPVVGPPFVDAVVRRFLLKRSVEIIKEEAYLPLTVSSIAARNHISVRALQRRFRDHFAVSPTEYLRQVRLRHAHRSLLLSDPSTVTVGGRLGRPQPEWAGFGRLVRSYIEGHKGERARYVTERTSMTGRRHRALKSL